jgi:hypothetical protein
MLSVRLRVEFELNQLAALRYLQLQKTEHQAL